MKDNEFLSYCDAHSQTELALFSGRDVNRICEMAGIECPNKKSGSFTSIGESNMQILLNLSKERLDRTNTAIYMENLEKENEGL